MQDYQYTSPDIKEESKQLLKEYTRIYQALQKGEYPLSHCHFIIYTEDKPKGYWGTERLHELLERFRGDIGSDTNSLYIATVWSDEPDISPIPTVIEDEETIPSGTLAVVKGGTAMNFSDFIYACCSSGTLLDTYLCEIVTIILSPLETHNEEYFHHAFDALTAISETLAQSRSQTTAH